MRFKAGVKEAFAVALAVAMLAGCVPGDIPPIRGADLLADAPKTPPSQGDVAVFASQGPAIRSGNVQWKYLDEEQNGYIAEQGQDWTLPAYDDGPWKAAAGSFGAKDGALAALYEGCVPDNLLTQYQEGTDKNIPAYFFRTTFYVENAKELDVLSAEVAYDDSIAIYLNGERIYEANVPQGGFESNFSYGAADSLGRPNVDTFRISAEHLMDGKNVLAVEVHQESKSSSDVYFDFTSLSPAVPEISSVFIGVGEDGSSVCFGWKREGRLAEDASLTIAKTAGVEAGAAFNTSDSEPCAMGYTYRANVEGLEENCRYSYTISCGGTERKGHFQTGSAQDGVDALLLGDPQLGAEESAESMNDMKPILIEAGKKADFTVCLGDVAKVATEEQAYLDVINGLLPTQVPGAMLIGNHDATAQNLSDSINLPNMTGWGARERSGSMSGDYWFQYGGNLFLCLNSNSGDSAAHKIFLEEAGTQYTERYGEPDWRIVFMHHSPFSQGNNITREDVLAIRNDLAPTFSEAGVDLVVSGHDHTYSRSYLMRGLDVVPYEGDGAEKKDGEVLYITLNSSTGSKFYDLSELQPYTAFCKQNYKAMLTQMHITPASVQITTWEPEGNVTVDAFTLAKAPATRTN